MIKKAGDMLVFVAGFPAIKGIQPLYFKEPVWQARAAIPAPKKSDLIIDDNSETIEQVKNNSNDDELREIEL